CRLRPRDLLDRRVIGEVKRHERLELRPRGECAEYALAIGEGGGSRRDRRAEVRHDDGAREACCGEGEDGRERCAIPQMQMPVIRSVDDECAQRPRSSFCVTFCLSSSSSASLTPKPVTSVGTCASPPLRVAEERSMCTHGVPVGTKRERNRVARM